MKKTSSYQLGRLWGPDILVHDFENHKAYNKLLVKSENICIDYKKAELLA